MPASEMRSLEMFDLLRQCSSTLQRRDKFSSQTRGQPRGPTNKVLPVESLAEIGIMLSLWQRPSMRCTRIMRSVRSLASSTNTAAKTSVMAALSSNVEAKHYIPRKQRSAGTDSFYEIDNIYDQRLKRRRRVDPTRELNYTWDHWERHKSVYRRLKHMLTTFGSSPFQRLLFPDFFVSSLVAGGLTYYNELVAIDSASQIWMDGKGVAAGTTAIALLTGFRLNASYGRFVEGRKLMGQINTSSRDLAMSSLMWLRLPEDKERMLNLIKAFSVAMAFHLNKKGGHNKIRRNQPNFHEQVYAEYRLEMCDVFHDEQDSDFVQVTQWFRNSENVPLGILLLMRGIISRNHEDDGARASANLYNKELDHHVQKLMQALGGSERIQKTPIPTCFTRHTSRLLFVWSTLMPFAIYPVCGPLFTLPSTIGISYSIMGIEDIGVQLEEPFNILPLRQYSDGVFDGIEFIKSADIS